MLQIMGIRIADDMAVFQIGMLLFQFMILGHIFDLGTGKLAVRRNEAQVGQQTVGRFVNMGRYHDPVVIFCQIKNIIKRNICGINEQIRYGTDDFIIGIIELLFGTAIRWL